jgi:membrane-associated phospholipid phosphatase
MRLSRVITSLVLAAQLALANPARADDIPFTPTGSLWRETFGTMPADVRGIVTYPIDNPRQFGKAVAGIGLLVLLDKPLTELYQSTIEKFFSHFALPQAPWSKPSIGIVSEDVWLLSGIAGSYIYGSLAHDDRARRAALLSSKAIFYSFVTSQLVLKTVFSRKRPYPDLNHPSGDPGLYTGNPYDFFEWHGSFLSLLRSSRSMPSYHFSEYLSVARVYSGIYNNSPVPYYIAGVLAVSNIQGHHHWVSDMVAGSAIGYGIGSLILKNDREWRVGHMQAMPVIGPDSAGINLSMQF